MLLKINDCRREASPSAALRSSLLRTSAMFTASGRTMLSNRLWKRRSAPFFFNKPATTYLNWVPLRNSAGNLAAPSSTADVASPVPSRLSTSGSSSLISSAWRSGCDGRSPLTVGS